ncbi:hypothetical protein GGI19_002350 [Coemansia pectinata]|uniref:Uncharacterized protein n=1 Tax=Coemansia pectinata TaxID=1052879 RepID=A0A9W8GVZ2_9FUNG|nr:hypothetical protein GGI19_002350 [Coemansia pectinata]
MAHINDLPADVLAQIMFKAAATPANRLSQWKAKLPLLAVCRAWTKQAICAVFDQVYIELFDACPHCDLPMAALAYNNNLTLTSNVGLLISRNCTLVARRLKIELADRATTDHLLYIVVIILKLHYVDWMYINTLTITGPRWVCKHTFDLNHIEETSSVEVGLAVQFFATNMRNLVEFNLTYPNIGFVGEHFYATLVSAYGGQLQVLRALSPNSFPISIFSRNVRVLELTLDSLETRVLPSICGETLKVLKLEKVPRNFAWHYFRYDDLFDQPIAFRQLTVLQLDFKHEEKAHTEDDVRNKIASGAYNCDQLSFPALKQLSIQNCTPDCDLLYADLPFPKLKKVDLSGSISSIRHCSRLKLTWVRDLSVVIFSAKSDDTAELYRVTNRFFTDICIGRTASLRIYADWFILDPELMRWVNLTKLDIRKVDYATVCKAIGRLPNLCELTVHNLEFSSVATYSFLTDSSLFISPDPMLAWGAKLKLIVIVAFDEDYPLPVCASGIQALILHAGALSRLEVSRLAIQHVAAFIDIYKDRYPHLANMQLWKK